MGAVHVFKGAANGITTEGNNQWTIQRFWSNWLEEGDQAGYALTFGDFNGDGNDDLAIGTPGADVISPLPPARFGSRTRAPCGSSTAAASRLRTTSR